MDSVSQLGHAMRGALWFLVGVLIAALTVPFAARADSYTAVEKYGFTWNNAPYTTAAAHGSYVCATYGNATIGTAFAGHYGDAVWPPGEWAPGVQHVACTGGTQQGPLAVGYDTNQFLECPGGGTLSGTTCTGASSCTPPETRVAGVCTAPSCPAAGEYGTGAAARGTSVVGTGAALPSSLCINGCAYSPGQVGVWAGGEWASDVGAATGASCAGTAPGANPCPGGQIQQSVQGTPVCIPATAVPNAVVQANDTTTTSTSGAGGAATGSSTVTATTTCTGTVCTTTTNTVTKDANGTITGGSITTSERARDPFCTENPQSIICRQTFFTGACGAFACDGDGVQCAIALEQHKRNCELFGTTSSESQRAAQFAAGDDPDASTFPNPAALANRETRALPDALDQSTFLGGGGLLDVTTSFQGQSITVPFSQMTGTLQLLGNLLVAFALLAGAMIVFRG